MTRKDVAIRQVRVGVKRCREAKGGNFMSVCEKVEEPEVVV